MSWKLRAVYSTWTIKLYDRLKQHEVVVTRRVEEYQGWAAFGRFSYRGERLRVIQSFEPRSGCFYAEDYPPPLSRCRTKRTQQWWDAQESE